MPSRFDSTSARRVTLGGESRVVRVWNAVTDRMREAMPETPKNSPVRDKKADEDDVDLAVDESFPASDPPPWTSSHASARGIPPRRGH